jgi:hypothetical protein
VRHFLEVAGAGQVDVLPMMMALQRRPELWDRHTYRTSFTGTPFAGMSDILLRYSAPAKHEGVSDPLALVNDTMLEFYPAWHELPEVRPVIFNLMRRFEGISLGRVVIARLPPGGTIAPHADDYGTYAARSDGMRFHVALQGLPGCLFHCGGETVTMASGSAWWFDHKAQHSVENHSSDDRVHLLVDVQTG